MTYIADLQLGKIIGSGSFGSVFLCQDQVHGQVAAKHFYANKFPTAAAWQDAKSKALNEAKFLKSLEHPNILKVYQVLETPADSEFLIVTEYCEAGSARDITKRDVVILKEVKGIIRDSALGLNFIHGQQCLH